MFVAVLTLPLLLAAAISGSFSCDVLTALMVNPVPVT
jgi:hypothetical protein